MSFALDRRSLLLAAGSGLLLVPGQGLAQLWPARGFTHNVASGEPTPDSMLLWTRFVGSGGAVPMRVEVASDAGFGRIVARGEGQADPAHDWCVRTTVTGLKPAHVYYYRFKGPDGTVSPVGRTKTLPAGPTKAFKVAVFSCANKPFGFFNAYGHAAARNDVDLMVHLGDYIYEYPRGEYPSAAQAVAGRVIEPAGEILSPSDYHLRYASYRVDPDLQKLHQYFPMISTWDDHEFANDAWKGGAENHQPDEGDWEVRKATARAAYTDWMPVSGKPYHAHAIGDLVTLIVADTRIEGRDRQLDFAGSLKSASDMGAALAAFRDGPWSDASRTLMGLSQEQWMAEQFATSVKSGTKWQLLAQQIVMGNLKTPPDAASWLAPDAPKRAQAFVQAGIAASKAGLPFNYDSWGGYAPARARLLGSAQAAGANLVVVSGDSHNAWAFDLANDGKPAGVEFAGQGVTSPGFESALSAPPATVATSLVAANPELKWADTSRRGYLTVTFTRNEARSDWVFMDTIRDRTMKTGKGQAAVTRAGSNTLTLV